jgi:membrane fusion protein (multidrug efflux system)
MPSPFSRTIRSLESHRTRPASLVVALAVLVGWLIWMWVARVTVYASSSQARIEVSRIPNRVAAQEAGRVVGLHVELGRVVSEGEVLVDLDAVVEERRLEEQLAHAAGLQPKIDALRHQLAAEQEVRASQARLNSLTTRRAEVGWHQARAIAEHQEELDAISQKLGDDNLASRVDRVKSASDAVASQLNAEGAGVEVSRLGASKQVDETLAVSRIAQLERQLVDLDAEQIATKASIETTRAQVERRKVRAPASGKLGNIAALQVGDVLKVGDVVATVIPSDDVHIVAEFAPSDALGRVLPGQDAWVRLAGFSWTQFGMVHAVVTHVASEPRDGTARVELLIARESTPAIPIQHGLPGAVDVEVERVAPWELLVRSMGAFVARVPTPDPAPRQDISRAP